MRDKRPPIGFFRQKGKTAAAYDDTGRVQMDGDETYIMELILFLDSALRDSKYDTAIHRRCDASSKNAWRMLCQAKGIIRKLTDELLLTVPGKQLEQMTGRITNYRFDWVRKTFTVNNVIDANVEDVGVLVNTTMANECALCLKEGHDENVCKVRHALMGLAACEKTDRHGVCPYRRIATDAEYGKYIDEE